MVDVALHAWRGFTLTPLPDRAHATIVELHRRSPVLSATGWLLIAAFIVSCAACLVDGRTIGGVSIWLKPAKFAVSIALYLWTLAWILYHLRSARVTAVVHAIALVMLLEFLLIFSQAARGTASHFNAASAYDVAVYRAMGILVLANTLMLAYVTLRCFRGRPPIPAPYLLGIRLGLAHFLLAAVSGGIMIAVVSHRIGDAGDLRVAHFIALHLLQAIPAAGWMAHRLYGRGVLHRPARWVGAVALLGFLLHASALVHALSGGTSP